MGEKERKKAKPPPPSRCYDCSSISLLVCVAAIGLGFVLLSPGTFSKWTWDFSRGDPDIIFPSDESVESDGEHYVDTKPVAISLGPKGALLFRSLDEDGDGMISIDEFAPVVERLVGEMPQAAEEERFNTGPSTSVHLEAELTPLVIESMKIYEDEGYEGLQRNAAHFQGFENWKEPAFPVREFESRHLSATFSPKAGISPGEAYFIFNPNVDKYWQGSSKRYFPPVTKGAKEMLQRLLSMFHRNTFVLTRFGPHGSVAVVRAENEEYQWIQFRIHAEYQVNEPPALPFWMSPAQFAGSLILKKDGSEVQDFQLFLPTDRKLNMDMEWITEFSTDDQGMDSESMEVEIGYVPKMKINMAGRSGDIGVGIKWNTQMTAKEAQDKLDQTLYTFRKVEYHSFVDSLPLAQTSGLLIHSVILWGALDDQSC